MVVLRSKNEISGLRRAGELVARALVLLRPHVRAGVRLAELDRITEEFIGSEDGEPTYKGYRLTLCSSLPWHHLYRGQRGGRPRHSGTEEAARWRHRGYRHRRHVGRLGRRYMLHVPGRRRLAAGGQTPGCRQGVPRSRDRRGGTREALR